MLNTSLSTIQTLLNSLRTTLNHIPQIKRFCIAFSGGKDSHILLHALTRVLPSLNIPLSALHINHGLHPEADQWERHCKSVCDALQIPFISQNITQALQALQHSSKQGLEADARTLRYQALGACLQADDCLLTAHHQEDQAETVLLQLMRGSGMPGLASMPFLSQCGPALHARPLLQWTQAHRTLYAQHYKLQWIEDSSNQTKRFARNFTRLEVLPLLKKRWPGAVKTLVRTAKHSANAANILRELAIEDLAIVTISDQVLSLDKLLKISVLRRHNLLRYWLKHLCANIPSEAQLMQLEQLIQANPSRTSPKVTWQSLTLRRYRDRLYLFTNEAALSKNESSIQSWDLTTPYVIKGWGTLYAKQKLGQGLRCTAPKFEIRFRQGGERFHPQGRSGSHPLKKLFQEWGIPPWERAHIPLLYYNNQLIAVAHYAVLHSMAAKPDELGFCIEMTPDSIK